ncbi:MAG: AAA family ATPase [Pseudomonadota bacterium]
MYHTYFGMKEHPFAMTPDTDYFIRLPQHQTCIDMLCAAIGNGEGFIKITGEVGIGKTLICRHLISLLNRPNYYTAYIPSPNLTPSELRYAVAYELNINVEEIPSEQMLTEMIYRQLIHLARQGLRVVLIIDESQAMSVETLEALRLITNLETQDEKLIHVVLFGQPELNEKLSNPNIRQLNQRITFSYHLNNLARQDVKHYVEHRLHRAGYVGPALLSDSAYRALYRYSKGVPRIINVLCHKALLLIIAERRGLIDASIIRRIAKSDHSNRNVGWTSRMLKAVGF